MDTPAPQKSPSRAVHGLTALIGALLSYGYCALTAGLAAARSFEGGGLYLALAAALTMGYLLRFRRAEVSTRPVPWIAAGLTAALSFLLPALTAGPLPRDARSGCLPLAAAALCSALRPFCTRLMLDRALPAGKKQAGLPRVLAFQMLFLPPLCAALLFSRLSRNAVWALAGGFVCCAVTEAFPLREMRRSLVSFTPEETQDLLTLRGVYACRAFRRLTAGLAAALQAALALGCACAVVFIGALGLPACAAALGVCAAPCLAGAVLARKPEEQSDPNRVLAAGLALLVCGLILTLRLMNPPASLWVFLPLALCAAGGACCLRVLARMAEDMRRAAAFGIGHAPSERVDAAVQSGMSRAFLTGQFAALAVLTAALSLNAGGFSGAFDAFFPAFRTAVTLPALLLAAAACVLALLFPLTQQHLKKLRRYALLQSQGVENEPLREQLERAVVRRSVKNYGIKLVIYALWPPCYHRVRGTENVHLDEDIPCVFVCNHGEIYGPVVTVLYVPYPFRPWQTYEMLDRQVVADHSMNGTFQNVKGFRRTVLNFLMHSVAAPALVWIMRSVNGIAVYHDNPRKLMQTFRDTVAAMEAGDNILLFPENAATTEDHRYAREGVSEFFTGFVTIGQLYSRKTGKCPLFVPMYANKHTRTITFGTPTRYNAEHNVNEEKERICAYLREEMLRIAQTNE